MDEQACYYDIYTYAISQLHAIRNIWVNIVIFVVPYIDILYLVYYGYMDLDHLNINVDIELIWVMICITKNITWECLELMTLMPLKVWINQHVVYQHMCIHICVCMTMCTTTQYMFMEFYIHINSLVHGKSGCNFKNLISNLVLFRSYDNALIWMPWDFISVVLSGNKPLPEPMLTQICFAIWRHLATMS